MSLTLPWPRKAKHDPDSVIRRLRQDVASLLTFKAAADDFFALLVADRDDVYACWRQSQQRAADAEQVVVCLQADLDAQTAELNELRAFKANAEKVSQAAGQRDVDPDDQPTHPTGIDVTTLWDALGVGPVHAVTDPSQTTWGAAREAGDTPAPAA
ncbi:hypothetical protein [Streptomyces lunaelactis]|uniref:hypothetical protein n=1 Tax=Streptomyces lunaelactis TaxID=1535768 RepID=UPI001584E9B6|nr:hypothetical protein [Streptomyces lunaelactis]NUL13256.1 hypothetical protein [Streptomyces lunaelactis]